MAASPKGLALPTGLVEQFIGMLADAVAERIDKRTPIEQPKPVTVEPAAPSLLTLQQAAERLQVDVTTLWKWERNVEGFPKRLRLPGNQARYVSADIEAWIEARPRGMA